MYPWLVMCSDLLWTISYCKRTQSHNSPSFRAGDTLVGFGLPWLGWSWLLGTRRSRSNLPSRPCSNAEVIVQTQTSHGRWNLEAAGAEEGEGLAD